MTVGEYSAESGRRSQLLVAHPATVAHPVIALLPAAFFVGALVSDILYRTTQGPSWPGTSVLLIIAALAAGVVAVIADLIDFVSDIRPDAVNWAPVFGNVSVILFALFSLLYRVGDPEKSVLPLGFALALVVAAVLFIGACYGGELAFWRKAD